MTIVKTEPFIVLNSDSENVKNANKVEYKNVYIVNCL